MPRIAKESEKNIKHPIYPYARITVKGDIWHINIRDKVRISTHIRYAEGRKENKTLAMARLNEVLAAIEKNTAIPDYTPRLKIQEHHGIMDLIEEFITVKKDVLSKSRLNGYIYTFRLIFTQDVPYKNHKELRRYILKRVNGLQYKPSTKKEVLNRLKTLFTWAIKADYLHVNPIAAIEMPQIAPSIVKYPDKEQQERIFAYFENNKHMLLYCRLLSLTGMRASEALQLRKSDIEAKGFRIDGKRKRIGIPKVRYFLFDAVPGVKEIIHELTEQTTDRLFPFSYLRASRLYQQCMHDLGMSYTLHDFRRYAKHYWEIELRIPIHVANMLAGHSLNVRSHYHATADYESLEAYLGLK